MTAEDELMLEHRGNVAVLTLNRPEKRNALSVSLLASLLSTLEELEADRVVRCAVIRGSGGKAFSSGMDLTGASDGGSGDLQGQIEAKGPLRCALEVIETCPFSVIAMIQGYAVGAGCELALACDLRVGADDCRMGMPPARLGIVYPPEGLERFIRTVGFSSTKKLFFTAKIFEIEEVKALGLLDYVVPADEIEERTMEIACGIAGNAPLSVSGLKRSLLLLSKQPSLTGEDRAEIDALAMKALESEDVKEGLAAFVQKRGPVFKGL